VKIGICLNSLSCGGVEKFVFDLAKGLSQTTDCEPIIIAIVGGLFEELFKRNNIEVRYGAWNDNFKDIDLINIHASGFGYAIAKEINKPIIETLHSHFCIGQFRECDYYIYNNEQLLNYFIAPEDKRTIIYPGVEIPDIIVKPVENIIHLGYLGRIDSIKRVPPLVIVFNDLVKENPDVDFSIIGDGEEGKDVVDLISKYGLKDKVHYYGFRDDFGSILENWDIILSNSLSESFGLAQAEAMSYGAVSVSTPTIGSKIVAGENGFFSNNMNIDSFRFKLKEVISLPKGELNQLKFNARERIKSNFSLDKMVKSYIEVFKKVGNANV